MIQETNTRTRRNNNGPSNLLTTFGTRKRIRIGQWNVRTLREASRLSQLERQFKKFNISVLGISEMRWCGKGQITSTDGNVILYSGKEKRGESGVGFIISKDVQKALKEWEPVSERIITARFFTKIRKCVTIIQCYAPTEEADDSLKNGFYDQLTATIRKVPNRDILLLTGDFNAKIGSENTGLAHIMGKHGMGLKNNNGERFIELCQTFDMVIGGSIFPHKDVHKYTWTSPSGNTRNQIDHICIRRRWRRSLEDVRSKRGADIDSDHELVVAEIKIKLNKSYGKNRRSENKRFDVSKLADNSTRDRVADLLRERVSTNDSTWDDTCKTLNEIARNEIGYKKKEKRKVWITDGTWRLIKERNDLKERKLENLALEQQYRNIAKAVKTSARRDKRTYFENLATDAEAAANSNNMRKLHQLIGRLANSSRNREHLIKDTDGNLLTNVEDQTKRWKEHFEAVSNVIEAENEDRFEMQRIETTNVAVRTLSTDVPNVEEIMYAIWKLKRNKTPGEDRIPPELLQANPLAAAEICYPHIKNAWINECLPSSWTKGAIIKLPKKNDLTKCDNWRGITLLNTIYKIMAIIINSRLEPIEKQLRDEQAGFRPYRNCLDQTNTLRVIIEQSIEWRSPLYLVFIDFKKAFDTIKRQAIWNALRAKCVPEKLIKIIQAMYTNSTVHVRHKGMASEPFSTNAGVKQGCPLSPLLFAVVLDQIMLKLEEMKRGIVFSFKKRLEDLDFADDICLLTHNFHDMQNKLTDLTALANNVGLEINIEKTKAMRINNNNDNHFMIGGKHIEDVQKFCYLGCIMSIENGVEDDVSNRLKKARSTFGRLNKTWRSTRISQNTKMRIFNACVKSTLLYGSETWLMTNNIAQKLQVFINKCLRIICRIFWPNKISNDDLLALTEEEPIIRQIARRKWKWIGHTLRKDEESIARMALEWNPQGSRRPGRPRMTWRRTILNDLKNINKSFDDIKILCNDRIGWNILVEALCSHVE